MSSASPAAANIGLQASIERVNQTLRVKYTLANPSKAPIGAFDGAAGSADEEWPDLSGKVYVSLVSRDVVALKRVAAPPPQNERIDVLRLPPASRLDPGESRTVRFSLPLPLVEHSEYFPASDHSQWKEGNVACVRLAIGYQRAEADARFQPLAEHPGTFKLAEGFGFQEIVSTESQITVPVRARADKPFERV